MRRILPIALALLPLMAGCQHHAPGYGETRHERDRAKCAQAAKENATDMAVSIRPDGTCDITYWSP